MGASNGQRRGEADEKVTAVFSGVGLGRFDYCSKLLAFLVVLLLHLFLSLLGSFMWFGYPSIRAPAPS